ncbi:hypothetical protein PG990_013008 [Apiospora arundinis]
MLSDALVAAVELHLVDRATVGLEVAAAHAGVGGEAVLGRGLGDGGSQAGEVGAIGGGVEGGVPLGPLPPLAVGQPVRVDASLPPRVQHVRVHQPVARVVARARHREGRDGRLGRDARVARDVAWQVACGRELHVLAAVDETPGVLVLGQGGDDGDARVRGGEDARGTVLPEGVVRGGTPAACPAHAPVVVLRRQVGPVGRQRARRRRLERVVVKVAALALLVAVPPREDLQAHRVVVVYVPELVFAVLGIERYSVSLRT